MIHKPNIIRWDIFLAHNSSDKKTVERLARKLRDERKLAPWFDVWSLKPGQSWQRGMEEGIRGSSAGAVLIGKDGIGPWESEEMEALLHLAVRNSLPIIPVLLPGAPKDIDLPVFLASRKFVDLRSGLKKKVLMKSYGGYQEHPKIPLLTRLAIPYALLMQYFLFAKNRFNAKLLERLVQSSFLRST